MEILSILLRLDEGYDENILEYKGIVGNIWFNGQLLANDRAHPWMHRLGLVGELLKIYTEQGSPKVDWNTQWSEGINKPITWFQARCDLDHLVREDTNANSVLLDAQGLKRSHAFINEDDIGLYWLIQGIGHDTTHCCCQQAQINLLEPTQCYYHISSDWLKAKIM